MAFRPACCRLVESVSIYDEPAFPASHGRRQEIWLMNQTLACILFPFDGEMKKSVEYQTVNGDAPVYSVVDSDRSFILIHDKMNWIIQSRKRKPGLLRRASWTLHDANHIKSIISDVENFIDSLERLSPRVPIATAERNRLVKFEFNKFKKKGGLMIVKGISMEVVESWTSRATGANQGNVYGGKSIFDD